MDNSCINKEKEQLASTKEELLVRRALLEEYAVPDAMEEFLRFQEKIADNSPTANEVSSHRSLTKYISFFAAAAACFFAVFLLFYNRDITDSDVAKTQLSEHEVYVAKKYDTDDVTLRSSKNKIHYQVKATDNPIVSDVSYELVDLDDYVESSATLSVPMGKVVRIVLPDKSVVWLNAGSRLVYPERFTTNGPRLVKLEGEAYFSVVHDPNHPFIVDGGGIQTKVLGTEFNVRNFRGEHVNVTLVRGSVSVSSSSSGNTPLILRPGQQASFDPNHFSSTVRDVDVEVYTSWREGMFYFDGQSLREVMTEIGRWYNMNVNFEDLSYLTDKLHFHGDRNWTIHQVIKELQYISSCQIRVEDTNIIVY